MKAREVATSLDKEHFGLSGVAILSLCLARLSCDHFSLGFSPNLAFLPTAVTTSPVP